MTGEDRKPQRMQGEDRAAARPGAPVSPVALVHAVEGDLGASGELAPDSLALYSGFWSRFGSFCEQGLGITDADEVGQSHVWDFLHATRAEGGETSIATRHLRRSALRLLYKKGRTLGLVHTDPTLDLVLPPRSVLKARPLTDDEVDLCRLWALGGGGEHRLAMVWALAEASARPSEIPLVTLGDVDVAGGRVNLAGVTNRAEPRWAALTSWGAVHIGFQIERLRSRRRPVWTPETPLVRWRPDTLKAPKNAASMAIIAVLRSAGIHAEPDVRPSSVTGWRGACLLRDGATIDEVALVLGTRSLDATARMIDFDWRSIP
jgi:hypothetical protein